MGPRSPCEGAIIRRKNVLRHARRHSAVSCAKVDRRNHKFNLIRHVSPMYPPGRTHWRNLAKAIEPSVCGGDAALCQITLTTCLVFLQRAAMLALQALYLLRQFRPSVRPSVCTRRYYVKTTARTDCDCTHFAI